MMDGETACDFAEDATTLCRAIENCPKCRGTAESGRTPRRVLRATGVALTGTANGTLGSAQGSRHRASPIATAMKNTVRTVSPTS